MDNIVNQPAPKEPVRVNRIKFIILIELLILLAVGVVLTLKNSVLFPTPVSQAENKMSVPMETKYENPFNEKTQYQNPFSENINPFDNLK